MTPTKPWPTAKIDALRQLVFAGIDVALAVDGHHKSYEGALGVEALWPSRFEPDHVESYAVHLHCYVLGPSRHYDWIGPDPDAVIDEATAAVRQWVRECCDEAAEEIGDADVIRRARGLLG